MLLSHEAREKIKSERRPTPGPSLKGKDPPPAPPVKKNDKLFGILLPSLHGRGWGWVFIFLLLLPSHSFAQYNTDRLIISGRIAYSNHDFVVAIQHFNNVLSAKPYLYEPWYYRGLCKLQLDDYVGAENDFDKALEINPYVHEIFAARAECRIRLKKFSEAIDDYEHALILSPDERGYWFNRAYCRHFLKQNERAHADLDYIVGRWPDMNMAYSLQTESI